MCYLRFLATTILLIMLSACQHNNNNVKDRYTPIRFHHEAPWALNVGSVFFVKDHSQSRVNQDLVKYLPDNLLDLIEQWVEDRFIATGTSHNVRIYIKEMDFDVADVASPLFRERQRFSILLKVGLEDYLYDPIYPQNQFTVTVERSDLINKNADFYKKEELMHELLRDVMVGLDTEVNRVMPDYFRSLIVASRDCEQIKLAKKK